MLKVGVTGGLCAGKGLVSGYFRDLGAATLDADTVAHGVLEDEEVRLAVIHEFGRGVAGEDGKISRRKLGECVFACGGRLKRLNDIVHPVVRTAVRSWLEDRESSGENTVAVVNAPLLIEADMLEDFDVIVVVRSERENQVLRCMNRDGLSREEALARINAQLPFEEKEKHADYVVRNDTSREAARRQVVEIWERLNRRQSTR
jgi:dephospho-CoA kinase